MDGQYLKVFVDWLDKYRRLSDAEFGRLMRAAIAYRANGEQVSLSGREEIPFDGIKLDIDRDRSKYETVCKERSEAGKKGAESRWNGKNGKSHLPHSKNSQDKDKDKDNMVCGGNAHARENDFSLPDEQVIGLKRIGEAYETDIGAIPSTAMLGFQKFYLEQGLSVDVIMLAIQTAAENNARSWPYIRTILERCVKEKIATLNDWERAKLRKKTSATAKTKPVTKSFSDLVNERMGV